MKKRGKLDGWNRWPGDRQGIPSGGPVSEAAQCPPRPTTVKKITTEVVMQPSLVASCAPLAYLSQTEQTFAPVPDIPSGVGIGRGPPRRALVQMNFPLFPQTSSSPRIW